METEKKIIGCCPLCGGNVVKTCKGYRCEHNIGDSPSCVLNINAIIGNRKMTDAEVTVLLEKRRILLDGFASKEGKTFPTVLELAEDGNILMQPVIGRCPHCGGEIRVGSRAFNCSNYANQVQLLQLCQPRRALLLCHLAQHRRTPAYPGGSRGNLREGHHVFGTGDVP